MKNRLKKMLAGMLTFAMTICGIHAMAVEKDTSIVLRIGDNNVMVNGTAMSVTAPFISNDITLVPLRVIAEGLGMEVEWEGETRTVTLSNADKTIVLRIDSDIVNVNGEEKTLLAAPIIKEDTTMLPIRFVSEELGALVGWDQETQTVTVTAAAEQTITPEETVAPVIQNDLEGKSAAFVGDSICYGTNWTGGYAKLIGDQENMIVTNIGVGGATIAKNVKWSEDSDGIRPCIVDQLKTLDGKYDYIIAEGGVNDFWGHVPLGNVTEGFGDAYDNATFAGGLETLFSDLKATHPESKLGYVIIHDPFTYNAEEGFAPYYDTIKTVCDKWGVPYIDLYSVNNKNTGINVKDNEQNKLYFSSQQRPDGDGTHPNELGYKTIYVDSMISWLKTI